MMIHGWVCESKSTCSTDENSLDCSHKYLICRPEHFSIRHPWYTATPTIQSHPSFAPAPTMADGDTGEASLPPPHVLVFPFPAQGHLTTMLRLAELLSLSGLNVTFLNTDHNDRRAARFSASYTRLSLLPTFRFRSIPDGLPDDHPRSATHIWDLYESLRIRGRTSLHELLVQQDGWPKVTCVIADGVMPFTVEVAEQLGIPAFSFRTVSACCVWAYLSIPNLINSGEIPFSSTDLDVPLLSVPGMEGILRRRDLPSFCRDVKDTADYALQLMASVTAAANQARGFILNTMEGLEGPILTHIRSHCPTTYSIGPLQALLDTVSNGGAVSASIWEEDRSCIHWLDSQPDKSVIYVSFGSYTIASHMQLLEFWHGLANSGHKFLWVLRPGLADGEEGDKQMVLPPEELEAAVRERGCLVGWAPQQEVLAHPAVGCFLTHSGWNSTLESITAGVPMICWPFFADQQINSRYVSEVWRVGLDMKDVCKREVVERMAREAMEGESSEKLRQSAAAMAEMVKTSVKKGGSSEMDFVKMVKHIRSLSSMLAH